MVIRYEVSILRDRIEVITAEQCLDFAFRSSVILPFMSKYKKLNKLTSFLLAVNTHLRYKRYQKSKSREAELLILQIILRNGKMLKMV